MIDLRAKPFFLHDEDIRWVEETLTSMTLEQRPGRSSVRWDSPPIQACSATW